MTDNPKPEWEWLENIKNGWSPKFVFYDDEIKRTYTSKDLSKIIAAVKLMKQSLEKIATADLGTIDLDPEQQYAEDYAAKTLSKLARGDF